MSKHTYTPVRSISYVGICLALLVICSKITIPTPAIQFTLQTLAVSFIALFLGPRLGPLTQTLFLLIGLAGVPVFAGGGGLGYVFRPSFGYLLAFIPASFLIGKVLRIQLQRPVKAYNSKRVFRAAMLASITGLVVIYLLGTAYFYVLGNVYLGLGAKPWTWFAVSGALLFLPTDLLSMGIASFIVSTIKPLRPAWLKDSTPTVVKSAGFSGNPSSQD